ncbi:peptide ABC transporter substrate-binding protein [Brachyspira murdochii]|uniref:Extracellular solute-binding protein family 5 n=1 Tax=Brachyspira murdochii (strain ATCC 51284 / DSM 12563 / 56-150) TaxID=526224 RepID=D5U804_BRAM5|nr:peptide ABC transporter substrate-binding protein [Brachyspira murdochii]ADG70827.1 extracellular solute-binding protein family 5 [Brachyspira murdochii DSM 12563]
MKKNIFIIIFIASIFLFSCSANNKTSNDGIVVSVGGMPSSLDPAFAKGINTAVYITHTFETLTQRDEDGTIIPALAESWEAMSNNTVYIFYLRDNAKWSDGKEVTANDFVYTLRRLIDPKVASPFSLGFDIIKNAQSIMKGEKSLEELGVYALDDYTLKIELDIPLPYFEEAMASDIASPVRSDIIETYGEDWALSKDHYIGNGPYIITEYDEAVKIVMEKNPYYWDRDNVKAQKITFEFLEDVNTAVAAIYADSILFYPEAPENERASLIEQGIGREADITSIAYYMVNLKRKPFNNPLVRKALALGIDRNYIVNNVLGGGRVAADGFVPINVKIGTNYFREHAPEYISLKESDYQKNIEEAKKLLADAGYSDIKKFPIIELITTTNPSSLFAAEAIQNMYKNNLGIDLKLRYEEPTSYLQSIKDGSFQMIKAGTSVAYNQAAGYLRLFQLDGLGNDGGYTNAVYDYLVDIAMTNANEDIRIKAAYDAERILIEEDMAIIPIYYDKATVMQSKKLHGVKYDIFSVYDFRNAYIE